MNFLAWSRDRNKQPAGQEENEHLFSSKVAFQKLDSMHRNLLNERWNICTRPECYRYSSVSYYENVVDHVNFLKDIQDEF